MAGKESDVVLNFKTNGEVSYSKTIKEINKEMNLAAAEYKTKCLRWTRMQLKQKNCERLNKN